MDLDKKQLLNQEDYLAKEKINVLNLNLIFSLLSMIFTLAVVICTFVMHNLYSNSIPLIYGLLSVVGVLNALFMFIWSFWQRVSLRNSKDKWGESTDTLLGRILLIASIFIFFGKICLLVNLHLWSDRALDVYKTSATTAEIEEFTSSWNSLVWVTTGFSIFNMLLLLYMIYAAFICCGSPNTIRILLYESCILQILFCFFIFNFVNVVYQYSEIPKIASFLDMNIYALLVFFLVVLILVASILHIINYARSRSGYLIAGSLKIILVLILISIGGVIYREALAIRTAFDQECREYLPGFSYDDVASYGCSPKYLEYGYDYLNCTDSEQALVWEDKINGEINKNQYSIGCLNKKCCNIVGDIYELNLLKIESFNIALLCVSFISISACFFLTNKYSGERNLKKIMEYLFMIILLFLFIAGILTLFLYDESVPQGRNEISVNSNYFQKSSLKSNYSTTESSLPSTSCSLIKNYNPQYNISNFSSNSVRTIILVSEGKLYYNNALDFKNLQIFDKDLKSSLFPEVNFSNKDILIFQGSYAAVKEFVEKQVYVCPYNLIAAVYIEYFTSAVNLTSNVADNSTLTWTYGSTANLLQTSESIISHKNQNLQNETESLSSTTNLTKLQEELSALNFGDLTIKTYCVDQSLYQSGVQIKIISGDTNSCTESSVQSVLNITTDEDGVITIYNLPYGKYTIIAGNTAFHSNCLSVTINQASQTKIIPLVQKLGSNQIAVLLEWNNASIDLNLFGAFEIKDTENCVVGYFNEECVGLTFNNFNDSGVLAQLVKITTLGNYDYLFYLKRELSWSAYQEKLVNSSGLNSDFLTSEFSLKGYVSEIQYPANSISYSGTNKNSSLINTTSIAYLAFCVNGTDSNILNSKGTFWTGNSTFPNSEDLC